MSDQYFALKKVRQIHLIKITLFQNEYKVQNLHLISSSKTLNERINPPKRPCSPDEGDLFRLRVSPCCVRGESCCKL